MFKTIKSGAGKSGITVVAVHSGAKQMPGKLELSADARSALDDALKAPGFKAEAGEVARAGHDHLLLGLGDEKELKEQTLRTTGGRLVRALDRMAQRSARLVIGEVIEHGRVEAEVAGRCIGEGAGLANWRVDFFDGSAAKTSKALPGLTLNSGHAAFRGGLKRGLTLADCTNHARRLAATPPNVCNPQWLAGEVRKMARGSGLRCQVISAAQAKQLGMGGLVNVGQGSSSPPCMIVLEHRPQRVAKAARDVRLVLVGKTMTYDSGGYSLKVNNTMKGMKYDKNGGMAVIGAMRAIAALDLPVRVWALLPAAENMVSGDAYRPDDIITLLNGVSVEVTNTDAEGRLILGDALAYACSKLEPTAIVDVATLTGGVVVALGSWCAGLWCDDDGLRGRLEAASASSGEKLWRLPLWEEHRDFMRAKHADVWNSGPKRDGHPIQGAAFLSYFVERDVPWAHIDIAGVSAVESDKDMYVQGPTGFGVRLLTDLVAGFAERQ